MLCTTPWQHTSPPVSTGGYCHRCNEEHRLPAGRAAEACLVLMGMLIARQTIDLFSTHRDVRQQLTTAPLFGPAGGKMFGVLDALTAEGERVLLHAFSGCYNGVWEVEGWAPPLFAVGDFDTLIAEREATIKTLGEEIAGQTTEETRRVMLRRERRQLSRALMVEIHHLYRLHNFHGETLSLRQAFLPGGNMPSGIGDCCAPKLIDLAARRQLRPLSLAEFYWGGEGAAVKRRHGFFYSSCASKCAPILGSMLCGFDG